MLRFLPTAFELVMALQAAQSAAVTGVVRDANTQQPLVGAVVMLTDLERVVITDAHGRYLLRDIPAGPQHIAVSVIGYSTRVLHALVPRVGNLEINFSLQPQPIALRTVVVRAPVVVRGVGPSQPTSSADRTVSMAAVRNHPMLAEPDVFAALTGGDVVMRPESPSGLHVRGGSTDQIAFLLDGYPVISPHHSPGLFSSWNPDAIARTELFSSRPLPAFPDALSGAVSAQTRAPGSRLETQGSLSTMQARITVDGPLAGDVGFLLSMRSGFPGSIVPSTEPSYVHGRSSDWLVKLESPLLGGQLQLLGYESEDGIDAAAVVDTVRAAARNTFDWDSRTFGASWTMSRGKLHTSVRTWNASNQADARWFLESDRESQLSTARNDIGFNAAIDYAFERGATTLGLRANRSRTRYAFIPPVAGDSSFSRNSTVTSVVPFVQHVQQIGAAIQLDAGAAVSLALGNVYPSPSVQLSWTPAEAWRFSVAFARLHQFSQSLRNAESLVGTIFPVDLFLAAGDSGVLVARSRQLVVAADYQRSGLRLGLRGYHRRATGLALVAPTESEPFASRSFGSGASRSGGLSIDASFSTARYGVVASYGWQSVKVTGPFPSYVPEHGVTHSLETGLIVFPAPTISLRGGITTIAGRRSTTLSGPLEWEACNLLDEGCEFGGSPRYGDQPLGATRLPLYIRADLGFRKHWHFEVGSRDGLIAVFGTVTNVFARRNLLAYAVDPVTGNRSGIEMRPLAPLVAGVDWRF